MFISEKCPNVFRLEWEKAANYLRAFRNPTLHGDIVSHLTTSEMERNIQAFLAPLAPRRDQLQANHGKL